MDKNEFLQYLHAADFRQLFVNSGWDNPTTTTPYRVSVGEATYSFAEAAQKKGFRVYVCRVEKMPDSSVRRVIDSKLRKASHEYLAVYVGASDFHHLWSVPVKSVDKRQLVTIEYAEDDQANFLRAKLGDVSFALEDEPTIIEVINKVNAAFLVNRDDVTKKFYQGFRKQHDQFVKCIEGIDDKQEREWYSSVMLNRLMFCYFVQKKEFLNLDPMYLQHKLAEVQMKRGEDKFYGTFYKRFLRKLFEDGLNSTGRSERFLKEFGRIPYLNGGMFELHALEKKYKDIDIPDKVFESLFAFFDQWRWHLDTHLTGTGRDINPDVLGYIFEQYINDRAQMGAYYTKEDITEYIGRNCIIPYLLGKVLAASPATAKWVWAYLRKSGDRCIFPAMLKGIELPLPDYIERGVSTEERDLRARRSRWNEKTDDSYALPTEIWRETVARRQRCQDLRDRIKAGKITDIHDFITYNLDIRTFVEDLIRATDDHLFVLHFYNALREVTILDPTCGSGAFLFAALNILEPLYEACLDRMEEFHEKNKNLFKEQLAEIKDKYRSNQKYFIYKNIILRNLYGVDIMHEATEIARLRLFLKMMAVVDVDPYADNLGLDPLPDIDFNIKCGNTLVGYASEKEIWDGLLEGDMFAWEGQKRKVSDELDKVALAFKRFRECQLDSACDREIIVREKKSATECQKSLRDRLDRALASSEYNIDSGSLKGSAAFDKWRKSTQPFHWYSEFYPLMQGNGGFDVIIGNPPYVSMSKIRYLKPSDKFKCSDLYGFVIRRVYQILKPHGRHGFIVMHNLAFSKDFDDVRKLIFENSSARWFSFYSRIPSGLFSGDCRVRNAIYMTENENGASKSHTTRLHRWYTEQRETLFETLSYSDFIFENVIPMSQSSCLLNVFRHTQGEKFPVLIRDVFKNPLYYKKIAYNFLSISDKPSPCYVGKKGIEQTGEGCVMVDTREHRDMLLALFVGRLYLAKWLVYGDDFHYTVGELLNFRFPFDRLSKADRERLLEIAAELRKGLKSTLQFKLNAGKNVGTYNTAKLWHLTDESDSIYLKYITDQPELVQEELMTFVSQMTIAFKKEECIEQTEVG